jgi:phage portal protein BeeE
VNVNLTMQKRITELLEEPNAKNDSFRGFLEPILEDILVLDAGCVEKVRAVNNQVSELWPVDGGQIRVNALWDGDASDPRYYWYPDGQERAAYLNDELIYMMMNPSTHRVIGLSPLETLKLTIDAELNSSDYNRRQVTEAAPDGLLNLGEGAKPEDVNAFKSYWAAEVAGKGALGIIGGTKAPSFLSFNRSNRDMQFMEWNIYLVRKIAAVFGISPQDLGITFEVNRSTAEVQMQNTEDRGLRPLMALVQDYITREIVWDPAFGGKENGLAFKFLALNLKESRAQAEVNKLALAGFPWKTPNEARKDDGREPLGPEYDELFMITPTGAVRLADVPTAREVLNTQRNPRPDSGGTGAPDATPKPRTQEPKGA